MRNVTPSRFRISAMAAAAFMLRSPFRLFASDGRALAASCGLDNSLEAAPSLPQFSTKRGVEAGACRAIPSLRASLTCSDRSLNHLVRPDQQRWRDRETQRLRRPEVDDQLVLG